MRTDERLTDAYRNARVIEIDASSRYVTFGFQNPREPRQERVQA